VSAWTIREERGSSILGFLLIIIPLCLFVWAGLDVGGIVGARIGLQRAAYAVVARMQESHSYDSIAQQALRSTLSGADVNLANVTVLTSAPASVGNPVWAVLSTNYQLLIPFPGAQTHYPVSEGASGTAYP